MSQNSAVAQIALEEGVEKGGVLEFDIARRVEDVVEAWRLVYDAYRRIGIINENEFGIHTVPQAVGPRTVVVLGRLHGEPVTTISAYADGPEGLPLDSVYRDELDALRREGRRLVEVGLLGDRRANLARRAATLFDLMRYVFFFAVHYPADDIVIGVHPHHAKFYMQCFAFDEMGPVKNYAMVNDALVVGLRLDLQTKPKLPRLARGLAHFARHPLGAEAYEGRFGFQPGVLRETDLGQFIASRQSGTTGEFARAFAGAEAQRAG